MRRASSLIGLPVISLDSGDRIGMVRELLVSSDFHRIVALYVGLRRWFKSTRALGYSQIFSLGDAAVTVKDRSFLKALGGEIGGLLYGEIISALIRTRAGEVVGSLSELLIDERDGSVAEFEVSEGLIQDILRGRHRFALPEVVEFRDCSIIVPDPLGQYDCAPSPGVQGVGALEADDFRKE